MKKQILFAVVASAIAVGAHAQEAPSPDLGCQVFDHYGKVMQPRAMSDKQLLQVVHCWDVAHAQQAQAQARAEDARYWREQRAESDAALHKIMQRQDELGDQLRDAAMHPAFVGGAQIPYPAPGNAATVILQTQ